MANNRRSPIRPLHKRVYELIECRGRIGRFDLSKEFRETADDIQMDDALSRLMGERKIEEKRGKFQLVGREADPPPTAEEEAAASLMPEGERLWETLLAQVNAMPTRQIPPPSAVVLTGPDRVSVVTYDDLGPQAGDTITMSGEVTTAKVPAEKIDAMLLPSGDHRPLTPAQSWYARVKERGDAALRRIEELHAEIHALQDERREIDQLVILAEKYGVPS